MKKGIFRLGLFVIFAAIGAECGLYIAQGHGVFGMNAEPSSFGPERIALGYGATIIGVSLGAGYRSMLDRKRITSIRKALGQVFYSTEFWLGLFGSPIVFALILQSASSLNTPGLITIALQNGFCCSGLASTLIERRVSPRDLQDPVARSG